MRVYLATRHDRRFVFLFYSEHVFTIGTVKNRNIIASRVKKTRMFLYFVIIVASHILSLFISKGYYSSPNNKLHLVEKINCIRMALSITFYLQLLHNLVLVKVSLARSGSFSICRNSHILSFFISKGYYSSPNN